MFIRKVHKPFSLIGAFVLALTALSGSVFGATIFNDNFETGNIANWSSSYVESGNLLEVIGTAAQEGAFGLHVRTTTTNDDAHLKKSITATDSIYTKVITKLVSDVSTGYHQQFVTAASHPDSGTIGTLGIRRQSSDPNNSLYTFAAGSWVDSGFNFQTNQWYCVETQVVRSTSAGAIRVWIDGTQVANRQNINTGSASITWLRLGADGPKVNSDYYFDDFRSDTTQIGCGPAPTPSPTPTPSPSPTPTPLPSVTPSPTPSPSPSTSPSPSPTPTPSPSPAPSPSPSPNPNVVLTRYPYMQSCAETSALIAWKTDVTGDSVVEYGPTSSLGQVASDPTQTTNHAVTLSGLLPETTYYYTIKTNGAVLASESFKTNKTAANPNFSFVGFGDSGDGTVPQQKVALMMDSLDPDFAVHFGDVVYDSGEDFNYDPRYFSIYKNTLKNTCMFPSLGNHDVRTANGQPYLDAFYLPTANSGSERYYSYDYANAHFVVVDSTLDQDKSTFVSPEALAMKQWVQNDLAATTKPWKFVYFHHASYSNGLNHFSDMRMRNELSPIFEQYNVDIVFAGHEHNYQRSTPRKDFVPTSNGVVYIVSGGGGGGLYGAPPVGGFTAASAFEWHLTRVAITGDVLVLQAIDDDGNIIDSYAINKGGPDSTAPVISQLASSDITSITAKVNWQTDDYANSKVEYGQTTSLGSTASSLLDQISYSQSHSITLDDLDLGTTYYYRAVTCNPENLCTTSPIQSFTTLAPTVITLNSTNLSDTSLDSSFPTIDYGTWYGGLQLGDDGTRKLSFATKWDISQIPAGATIRKATLQLYEREHYMEVVDKWRMNFYHVYDYPAYAIAGQTWFEGNSNGGACTDNELCWATRPTTASQMNLSPLNYYDLTAPPFNTFINFRLTELIREAVNMGEQKVSVSTSVERLYGDTGLDNVLFRSKEIGGSLVPKLTIEYYLP